MASFQSRDRSSSSSTSRARIGRTTVSSRISTSGLTRRLCTQVGSLLQSGQLSRVSYLKLDSYFHNLRVNPDVEIRDETVVRPMRVREIEDENERSRLWKLAIAAYPSYAEYQERTARRIPVFVAERS